MRSYIICILLGFAFSNLFANSGFVIEKNKNLLIEIDTIGKDVLATSYKLLEHDVNTVFSSKIEIADKGTVKVVIDKNHKLLKGKSQAFAIEVSNDNVLCITGSDEHGAAYGIIEITRMIGVSPWEWWADVTPQKRDSFTLPNSYKTVQFPSVEYRGIFINDEDWGLMPWSYKNYEKWPEKGHIGPRTNDRIFELLLRLRANTYWPAMHECTQPFFLTEGNREVAAKYGIYLGSSHCEPMACSAAVEWGKRGTGDYDYVNNSKNVYSFWEKRVQEVAKQEILYTIGMRGVHDGKMQGANTVEEQKNVLADVIKDQRGLLAKYVDKDVEKVPQVFIPYKEVLDIYNAGLKVPEDVTLMWCDDNYGYIRHFPTPQENKRKGGNGIYYHVSYWGRPHDYLWLGTFSPYLLNYQMTKAYDKGIRKMWILNVGDIKPAEYQIELFMDMAWNIDKVNEIGVTAHLNRFLCREFGQEVGNKILPLMKEHYRLAYIRKPEFMGNTREEEKDPNFKIVKDLDWSENTILKRLDEYQKISDGVENAGSLVSNDLEDAFLQLVKYPLQAAAQMNKKSLYAQLARHGKSDWNKSDEAFDSIVSLTKTYNNGIHNNGKWQYIMDWQPRKLPVFNKIPHILNETEMYKDRTALYKFNASEYSKGKGITCEGLGYESKAVEIVCGKSLEYDFGIVKSDSVEVELHFVPTHPVIDDNLRVEISADGNSEKIIVPFQTYGRSDEWKENVLRNQAIRTVKLPLKNIGSHKLTIKAIDEGVILDQLYLY